MPRKIKPSSSQAHMAKFKAKEKAKRKVNAVKDYTQMVKGAKIANARRKK